MGEFPNKSTQFSKDNQPEKNGRPKGVRNRATIVREIFDMTVKYPDEVLEALKGLFPDLKNNVTIEEAATIMQAAKAIQEKDSVAYKVLMDSAYGAPKQEIDTKDVTPQITVQDVSGKVVSPDEDDDGL